MPLSSGDQLGHYKIQSMIGKGGMGEVYRALDTRLERDVAIKVLPASVAGDPERLARFEREAKVVASLNHPNIATIYGVEDRALVMELVPGPTLADRIAQGPIPVPEALDILLQIADAMEYAHEKGIIHRDLKPANIKIDPEDKVKILDFGLAKALLTDPTSSGIDDPTNSPTITMGGTIAGTILGTAAYMAPEQARGKKVDRRADIWAFGVVVWEMLTGERLFQGEDTVQVLSRVLEYKPDLERVPEKFRRLVARCLDRNVKDRLRDIGEVRFLLSEPTPSAEGAPANVIEVPAPLNKWPWAVAALAIVIAGALAFLYLRQTLPSANTLRYTIAPPEGSVLHSLAVSPDGRLLAIAASVNGKLQLWLRPLDTLQAQPMPTTDDATFPFWSPDSRFIGFFAQGKLKKVAASGGPAESLCNAANARGGSWNHDDVIVFSPSGSGPEGLQRVPASGGVPTDVFKTKGPFRYPIFLPDGSHFLYTNVNPTDSGSGIYVGSLDGKEQRQILADTSIALFAAASPQSRTGHLLFVRDNNLMALPFDADRASAAGSVFPAAEGVSTGAVGATGFAQVTASENGVLLYLTGNGAGVSQLVWFDRAGKPPIPMGPSGVVATPALSPDEKVVAYTRLNPASSGEFDIWLWDLARATETRFATGAANVRPFWSPKGDRIVYTSSRGAGKASYVAYQKSSSGSGQDELLLPPTVVDTPTQWSRDGRFIVYTHLDPKTKGDLWVLPIQAGQAVSAASAKPTPFLQTEFDERMGQLSPDSRWIAYSSDESGKREVYVRPFPPGDGKVKISTAGGDQPHWRADGRELFYISADGKMTAVPVQVMPGGTPRLEPGVPVPLFEVHPFNAGNFALVLEYDVAADGKRFLVASTGGSTTASPPLTVVANWNAGSKK